MAERNLILQLLITAKDQASGILGNLKTQLAALGVAIAGAFSLKEAATFEKALDAVRARADETGPALDALIGRVKEAAQTIGPEFGFSATQAVLGIKELIAAGFSAEESIGALKGVLALAAMEGISLEQAALLISDAIAQFGLTAADATKVADVLAASAGAVAATATEMGEALKYTGNAASQAGLSLTETSAVLDVLAKAGQRGSEAGTGLASVLNILSNPAHAATQALFEMGATSTELGDVLDFLQSRGLNASEAIALFGEQGGRVINTLLAQGGTKAIADFGDQITNAGKSAEATAKIMQQNLLGAFDRFWESLKRVGVELATPKLEPFAKGLDTLTAALNTFASNDRIQAFQQRIADGFGAIYAAARDFANGIDWAGVQTAIGGAFDKIKAAADTAITSIQSIVASLTGTLPGAATLAQQASDGLKLAYAGLGATFEFVASGLERIAQSLAGPVAVGSDLAKQALAGLTGETDAARAAYDTLNSALQTGKATQEQVSAAWERLQQVIGESQREIDKAQLAYNAVVATQKAGKATQDQVNAAWTQLQTVMGSAQGKIDSARLAFDGLNLQFTTGKGLTEAVALAHERLNNTIEVARQSVEKITASVAGQTQGFQALWAALKDTAPESLKTTWDSLTAAAGDLLAGINALVQKGSEFLAGFIRNADLSPVRDIFNAVAAAASRIAKTIAEQFPAAEKAGANLADSFTVAWSGVVGILAAVTSGVIKVVESLNRAVFETGKFFGKYSQAEIAKIQANIDGMSDSAGEFAAVAARSFDASAAAIDRMRERANAAETGQKNLADAGAKAAQAQERMAAAAEETAQSQKVAADQVTALAFALQKQKAEVEKLAQADLSSEEAKQKHAAATQKLWTLQELFGEAVKGLSDAQFANVKANELVDQSLKQLDITVAGGAKELSAYVGTVKEAPKSLEEMRRTMEETAAELKRVEEAYKAGNLVATESKSIAEQRNEATKKAADGLAVYKAALDRNIAAEELNATTAERSRQAHEALARSGEAVIDASIELARAYGEENKVAERVAQKKVEQVETSKQAAEQYALEAAAAVKIAEALRLKYEAIVATDPLNKAAIQQAKEAADAAQLEATSKKAVAIEAAAIIPLREREAQQAEIMAGPVGQLTRLYAEQAKEHQRSADASERYHDAQVQEAEGELRLAQIKGDALEIAKAEEKVADRKIAQADDLAARRAQEATDAENALSAKALELAADGELTKADQEQLAAMEATTAAKRDAANAAQEHAEQMRDEAEAAKAAAAAQKAAAAAAAAAKEHAEQLKAMGEITGGILTGWAKRLEALSPAARAAFDGFRDGADLANASLADLAEASRQTGDLLSQTVRVGGSGFVRWANDVAAKALSIEQAFIGQKIAVQQAIDALDTYAEHGQFTAQTQQALALATQDTRATFDLLNDADLSQLQDAIDTARGKMEELRAAAQAALEEAQRALLQEKGDQAGVLELERKQRELELQTQINEAKAAGDAKALSDLQQALALEQEIYDLKLRKIQQQDAQRNAPSDYGPPRRTSGAGNADAFNAAPAKIFQLNLRGDGRELKAFTLDDPDDFLSRVERAQRGAV